MTMTAAQTARVESIRSSFASMKTDAKWLQASAKAAGDAAGEQAAFAAFTAICQAHVICGDRLLQQEPVQGGGIVIQGPPR